MGLENIGGWELIGLVLLLFLPSFVLWSVTALKESFNFLIVVCMLGATILLFHAPWRWRPLAAIAVLGSLGVLATFRTGAIEIAIAGLAVGLAGALGRERNSAILRSAVCPP